MLPFNIGNHTIGIALSGGGVRGIAHIGVLKALNEAGIYPQMISGVSAGAIVGALYAAGHSPDAIFELIHDLDLFELLSFRRPRLGIFKPDGLKKNLARILEDKHFEDLQLPLFVTATNLSDASASVFNSGSLVDAIMASSAIPLIIRPYEINGTLFVDGGLVSNLPVHPLLGKVDKVIGVNVNPVKMEPIKYSARNFTDRLIHIGIRANIQTSIANCDLFIEPPGLMQYHLFKLSAAQKIFESGYEYAKSYIASNS